MSKATKDPKKINSTRKMRRMREIDMRKNIRDEMKDTDHRAFIIKTQEQFFKMGYEKGREDEKKKHEGVLNG